MHDCPRFVDLLRWRDAGDEDAIEAHLDACPDCAIAWVELEALSGLGAGLPTGLPEPKRVESVRTAILAQAEAAPAPRRGWWIAAAAAVLLAAGAWWALRPVAPIGRIDGPGQYAVQREGNVERIMLRDGSIAIEVAAADGQQVIVQTADAELVMRGGRYRVEARGGRLRTVAVEDGAAELRRAGHAAEALDAGASWHASEATPAEVPATEDALAPQSVAPPSAAPVTVASAPIAPPSAAPMSAAVVVPKSVRRRPAARRVAAPPGVAPASAAAPSTRPQIERFEAAWTALRAGRHRVAADAFAAAARLEGPLRADAEWWHLVALGRSGDDSAARRAARRFMRRYGRSPRAAQAAVMLGWIEFEAGRIAAAETAFEQGEDARDSATRARAREGLDAIEAWRAKRR